MGELATELGCDASNITQIITRLEARNLVERQPNLDDGRSRQIVRTEQGEAVYAAFERSFEFARSATAKLSAAEQEQLSALLRKTLGMDLPAAAVRP